MLSVNKIFSSCWLISLIMSAHSKHDKLHKEDNPSISSNAKFPAMEINSSNPVSKDCVLEMRDSELTKIIQFIKSDVVNIVDIELFSGISYNDKLFADMQVSLVTPIGREIIYALDKEEQKYNYFPWTLNAGRRNVELQVQESRKGCIQRKINTPDFISRSVLKQIFPLIKQSESHEICYLERRNLLSARLCCHINEPYFTKTLKYQCLERDSFLHRMFFSAMFPLIMLLMFPIFYLRLLSFMLSYSFFDIRYSKYYKLEESTMSPSSIALKIIWKEQGRFMSFIRSSALMCGFSPFFYSTSVLFTALALFYAISFPLFQLCRRREPSAFVHSSISPKKLSCSVLNFFIDQMASCIGYSKHVLRQKNVSGKFEDVITMLTLPCNAKRWGEKVEQLFRTNLDRFACMQCRCVILKYLGVGLSCLICGLICVFYVFLGFLGSIGLLFLYVMCKMVTHLVYISFLLWHSSRPPRTTHFSLIAGLLYVAGIFILTSQTYMLLLIALKSFTLGIFLNLVYFIPYLASFSVLTFYCCSYWKSVEEKYFVLKRVIYEQCRDIQRVNNGCIPNRHPKRKEKVLPVVSRELYDKVREELLPYHTNLFYYGLKVLWLLIFSCSIFDLVSTLYALNISAVVQVLITASISIMPYVFNMEKLSTSEERKKAWIEKLKLNVKYMVEELTLEDPELARTVLIIQDKSNDIVGGEQDFENGDYSHGLASDNDDVTIEIHENVQYETSM